MTDIDCWHIGNIGGSVLIRALKHGHVIYEATFTPADALIVADHIVRQVHALRPPPEGTKLRRVK